MRSDKRPYTVGQTSLYSRTNVLKSPYTKLYNIQNPYISPLTQLPSTFTSLQYSPTQVLSKRLEYAAPCP